MSVDLSWASGDEDDDEPSTRKLVHSANVNAKKKKSGGFQCMGLSHSVLTGVLRKGYRVPTPIQRKTMPLIVEGHDVVAMARTGSGKTAAFLLPMFEKLQAHSAKVGARALVMSPTRELALQTLKFCKELGRFTGLRSTIVLGGDSLEDQFAAIHHNPDIIIATPGRFLHIIVEMELKLTTVEYVVFDEADRLFEMGFQEQLKEVISRLPENRQTLLFSATLPKQLLEFARAGLRNPKLIRLDVDSKLSDQLKTAYLYVRNEDKTAALLYLLNSVIKEGQQTVVFVATKHHVEYIKDVLEMAGIACSFVYSSLDPTARKINIGKFSHKKSNVLVVTDVAARGIDIPMLDNVINYHFPAMSKLFVHRVGRVARAGRSGVAYSLLGSDELPYLLDLHLFLGRTLKLADSETKASSIMDLGSDGFVGTFPSSLLLEEYDFLTGAHKQSEELVGAFTTAENGFKKYSTSRPVPSAESIKRWKEMPGGMSTLGPHPWFGKLLADGEAGRMDFLARIKKYKPAQGGFAQTIDPSMKTKRDAEGASRRSEHYISYRPSDAHTEKGLSLQSGTGASGGFVQSANSAVMDMMMDDSEMTEKANRTRKRWDRKLKRFVGDSGDGPKKMKTESGNMIKASFKSNIYSRWAQSHHVDKHVVGEEERSAGVADNGRLLGRKGRRGFHQQGAGRSREGDADESGDSGRTSRGGKGKRGRGGSFRGGRSAPSSSSAGLKSKEAILKERKKKAQVTARQQHSRGGRGGGGGSRGGRGGGGGSRGGRGGGGGGGGSRGGRGGGGGSRGGGGGRGGARGGGRGGRGGRR